MKSRQVAPLRGHWRKMHDTAAASQRAYNLAVNIVNYITDNGFYLIGHLGNHTTCVAGRGAARCGASTLTAPLRRNRWGVWAPKELNTDPFWFDERGLNSLQMLAFLAAGYRLSGEVGGRGTVGRAVSVFGRPTRRDAWCGAQSKLQRAFYELVNQHGYAVNIINQKITCPCDDNFSDDELAFLPYFTYHYNDGRALLNDEFQLSIDRAWHISRSEKARSGTVRVLP